LRRWPGDFPCSPHGRLQGKWHSTGRMIQGYVSGIRLSVRTEQNGRE